VADVLYGSGGQLYIGAGDRWVPLGGPGVVVTVNADASDAIRKINSARRRLARFARDGKRYTHRLKHEGGYSHCRACHPEQDRRPLPVDGDEYRRRQRARVRRNR
jgi:hypothetical protein